MRFDPISFLLGFGSAAGISFIAWRSRMRLMTIQQTAETQIEGTRRFIGRTADARYMRDMLNYLQAYHLAGGVINLTDVLVEPRLIPAPAPLDEPSVDDKDRDVFSIIPLFHDMPQSYAPFNITTMPLTDLGAGDRHIAILGTCGTGKTTTLVTLALMTLGEVAFETLEDLTQQAIVEEEKNLTKEQREQRAKERAQIQARALERLHDAHEKQRQDLQDIQAADKLPPLDITTLMPIFVHVNDLDLTAALYSKKGNLIDPAEPIVRAVQRQVSTVTGQVIGSVIYPALERGKALMLVDGYDELNPELRGIYLSWLEQFLSVYGHNMVVMSGPAEGYEPLRTVGFTPIFLRPWREDDYTTLAKRWGAIWTTRASGKTKTAPIDDQTMRRITVDNRGRTMLDVTVKIWAGLADDTRETGRPGWYDAWINRRLSNAELRDLLPVIAQQMLNSNGLISQADLEAALTGDKEDSKKAAKPDEIINALVADKVLARRAGDQYTFAHPQMTSYLASEILVHAGADSAAEYALDPMWQDALTYAASKINVLPTIHRKLSSTPDLIYSNLFGLVQWLPDAPPDAPWRGDLFKRLAAALMAPEQFPAVRARAMAALVSSRDKNVLFILRQALRSADPYIRQVSCIGLGAIGNPEAIKDLEPLLGDDDHQVQLAAGLALGAIGTERAMEVMVQGLISGTEELRRAVAEALAAIPGEGHSILRDGIEAEDLMIRRASVFGLSRVRAPWAVVALYRAMLEDEQWYVRNAAENAFMAAQSPDQEGPHAHPEADELPWLIKWAADRGEGVPAGINARQVLIHVLQDGEPAHKIIAALTLGRLAHVQALKPLYAAMRDRSPEVRNAAYEALSDIQMHIGQPLPGIA